MGTAKALLIASSLIASSLTACSDDGLHPLPPAGDCTPSIGASALTLNDSITVCVPGSYCPPGYNAGETYRDYHGSLRHPADWIETKGSNFTDLLHPTASLSLGPHELRLDEADALDRLNFISTAWPDAVRQEIEVDGRTAVHYTYTYDINQPGAQPAMPGEWTAINLDIVDGSVLVHLSGNAPTNSSPEVFCEIESMLATMHLE